MSRDIKLVAGPPTTRPAGGASSDQPAVMVLPPSSPSASPPGATLMGNGALVSTGVPDTPKIPAMRVASAEAFVGSVN